MKALFILLLVTSLAAQIYEYNYRAGEHDSEVQARAYALNAIRIMAAEEHEVLVESRTDIRNINGIKQFKINSRSYAKSNITLKILKFNWDGKFYYIKANAIVIESPNTNILIGKNTFKNNSKYGFTDKERMIIESTINNY